LCSPTASINFSLLIFVVYSKIQVITTVYELLNYRVAKVHKILVHFILDRSDRNRYCPVLAICMYRKMKIRTGHMWIELLHRSNGTGDWWIICIICIILYYIVWLISAASTLQWPWCVQIRRRRILLLNRHDLARGV